MLTWTNDPIKVLGTEISHKKADLIELNYDSTFEKIQVILNAWKDRDLSLLGKTMIINTPIGSLFVHKMNVLPNLDKDYVCRFEDNITKFIWNQKRQRIKLHMLSLPKDLGGVHLIDLNCKEQTLKISWVLNYLLSSIRFICSLIKLCSTCYCRTA